MSKRIRFSVGSIKDYFNLERYDFLKLVFLSLAYLCIVASYSILRSLKTSIFLGMVGKEYQPISRIISLFIIFPCGMIYSNLVDRLKRAHIFFVVIGIYAVSSIIFTFLLAHPAYGIKNTETNPFRLLGWFFEIFMDMYSALVLSTFWSFANSVSTLAFANKSYGMITAISRFGGIVSPILGWLLLNKTTMNAETSIPLAVFIGGLFLFVAVYSIFILTKKVPHEHLHGYEGVHHPKKADLKGQKPSVFEGIKLMFTHPYVLGIFGLVYGVEIISIIFDYQMQVLMSVETNNHIGSMSSFMFIYTASFQTLSLLFALFGTSTLLKKIGTQNCLLIMPFTLIGLSLMLLCAPSLTTIFIVMIILRALNYGFNYPVRETLYIPTVKDIQFKSKVWIESFGKTFSKSSGSMINHTVLMFTHNPYFILKLDSFLCIMIATLYGIVSFFMGRKYLKTIQANEIIGKEN